MTQRTNGIFLLKIKIRNFVLYSLTIHLKTDSMNKDLENYSI